jgi:hypothetical protein
MIMHLVELDLRGGKDRLLAIGKTEEEAIAAARTAFDKDTKQWNDVTDTGRLTWDNWHTEYGCDPLEYCGRIQSLTVGKAVID